MGGYIIVCRKCGDIHGSSESADPKFLASFNRNTALLKARRAGKRKACVKVNQPEAIPMPVTERFRVRAADGAEYEVICVESEIDTSTLAEGRSSVPGLPHYRLADGSSSVNIIDKDTFKIVATGKRVHRIR